MHFGIQIFPTDQTIQPIDLAKACEDRGFESLWLAEHSHIPISRETPFNRTENAPPLPEKYWRTHDSIVSLTAAAAVTDQLRLGTGISLVAQHDPIWMAKQVATLDQISAGRVLLGVGYGWNVEEMRGHGVEFNQRRELLREKVLMMKSLWTEDVASFQGRHVSLESSWAWPKPAQLPHPPILLGAPLGPKTLAHLVEFCDGWVPNRLYISDLDAKVKTIRSALEEAGRDPERFSFTLYSTPDESLDYLASLQRLGFARVVFSVESSSPREVLARLDQLSEIAAQYGTNI
jgi:probable F420-dependent oxidoreductase